jgi:hypothetical protein
MLIYREKNINTHNKNNETLFSASKDDDLGINMWTDAYSSYFVFTYGLFKDAVKS